MFSLDRLIKGAKSIFCTSNPSPSLTIHEEEEYPEIPYGFFENDEKLPEIERERAKYATPSFRRVMGVVHKHSKIVEKAAHKRLERAMEIPGSMKVEQPEETDDYDFDIEDLK